MNWRALMIGLAVAGAVACLTLLPSREAIGYRMIVSMMFGNSEAIFPAPPSDADQHIMSRYMSAANRCKHNRAARTDLNAEQLIVAPFIQLQRARRRDILLAEIEAGVRRLSFIQHLKLMVSSRERKRLAEEVKAAADTKYAVRFQTEKHLIDFASCGFADLYL